MSDRFVGRTAICYRADKSMKWATLLPPGTEVPVTTLDAYDRLWPDITFGRDANGQYFWIPTKPPIEGPTQ